MEFRCYQCGDYREQDRMYHDGQGWRCAAEDINECGDRCSGRWVWRQAARAGLEQCPGCGQPTRNHIGGCDRRGENDR